MFAVKDRAIEAFMTPWFAQSTGQAIRSFTDEINNPESPMSKHADDYDLYHIGTWTDNGAVQQLDGGIKQLVLGKQVKQ